MKHILFWADWNADEVNAVSFPAGSAQSHLWVPMLGLSFTWCQRGAGPGSLQAHRLECSLGMQTDRRHLHALPLLCSRAPLFPRREPLHTSGAAVLGAAPRVHLLIIWLWSQESLCSWSYKSAVICVTQRGAHNPVQHPDFCDCCQE